MDRVPDHGRLAGPAPGCPHWPPAGRRDTLETGRFARGWARLGGCKFPRFLNGFTVAILKLCAHAIVLVHCTLYSIQSCEGKAAMRNCKL